MATIAHRFAALRPVALCLLLVLSLLASLWQHGAHAPRLGSATSTSSSASEERGETPLEEESPAKLRRVASQHTAPAAQPQPEVPARITTAMPRIGQVLIPAAVHQAPPSLHSPRQQRGQAPPLA